MIRKLRLTHIDPMSLGKFLAVWTLLASVVLVFVSVFMSFFMALVNNSGSTAIIKSVTGSLMSFVLGIIGMFVFTLMAFVDGYLLALIYNKFLSKFISLEFLFDERR